MADGAADDSKRDHRYTSFMVAVWGGDVWAKAMSREAHLQMDTLVFTEFRQPGLLI